VNEITKIRLIKDEESTDDSDNADNLDDEHAIHNIIQNRPFMEAHCLRGKGNDCRYAFKRLQESCLENAQLYINGVVDLAVEARFLSVVRHPNIIKMRAMAATNPFSTHDPFFVVLDRLYDSTLACLKFQYSRYPVTESHRFSMRSAFDASPKVEKDKTKCHEKHVRST
jgi:hypothetical protein